MNNKRSNEVALLAAEIRAAADVSDYEVEKRTKYIRQELDNMSEEQLTRFEFFIRSHLPRNKVKDIITQALDSTVYTSRTIASANVVTDEISITVCGLAKLFIGELVEAATDILDELGATDGIKPYHIEEAMRRLKRDGKVGRPPENCFLFSDSSFNETETTSLFSEDLSDYCQPIDDNVKVNSNNSNNNNNNNLADNS
eukprot:gene7395-10079_t